MRASAALALMAFIQAVALVGNVPSVAAADGCNPGPTDDFHCYSEAWDDTDANSYTGVRELRVVQNLNLAAPGGYLFTPMWFQFLSTPNRWVELGTAYGNSGEWDFG